MKFAIEIKKTMLLVGCTFALGACGLIDELKDAAEELAAVIAVEDQVVTLSGKAVAETAGTAINSAVNDAVKGANGGAAGTIPSNVSPQAGVFEDDTAAAAPAYGPLANDDQNKVSDWMGPEVGPDGEAGWYRRTWSYSYNDVTYDTNTNSYNTQVTDTYSYWFRSMPDSDFSQGWHQVSAEKLWYAWTAESARWADATWLMTIEFKQPSELPNGTLTAGSTTGNWHWTIDSNATHFAGTKGEGHFRYSAGGGDHFLEGEEVKEVLKAMAIGDTFAHETSGDNEWEYNGTSYGYDNKLVQSWFGGGKGKNSLKVVVEKIEANKVKGSFDSAYNGTNFWGIGASDATIDYLAKPAYSETVTPPGDAWAVLNYHSNDNNAGNGPEERDGLLYWGEYEGKGIFSGSGEIERDESDQKGDDDNDNDDEGSYEGYSRSSYMSYRGGKVQEYVYCSSPDYADFCPADDQYSND